MSAKKDKELAKQFYTVMYRTRRFEEEVFEFYKRGLMPGLAHLYLGEEAVATGACATLRDDDYIGSTHRGHGHLVARGADLNRMMATFLATPKDQTRIDQWQSQIFARLLMRATVIYISDAPDEMVSDLHMVPAHSLEEAMKKAEEIVGNPNASVCAIPDGVSVIVI